MKIIVTGATSMIGVAFIEACINNGHKVLAILHKNSKNINRIPKSDLIKIQYASLECYDDIKVEDEKYDAFYHFAWAYTSREGRYNLYGQELNIRYTLDAVNLAYRYGCKLFVGAGSQSEYGKVDGIINKDNELNPQVPYSIAKASSYWMSRQLCHSLGMKQLWPRIFSVYGKYDSKEAMINYAINKFLNCEKASFSSGLQMWNYISAYDAGQMLLLLCEKDVEEDIYFIAHPESKPLKEYIFSIINEFDNPCYEFRKEENKCPSLFPNMKHTMSVLDYSPKIDFSVGIREIIDYYRL